MNFEFQVLNFEWPNLCALSGAHLCAPLCALSGALLRALLRALMGSYGSCGFLISLYLSHIFDFQGGSIIIHGMFIGEGSVCVQVTLVEDEMGLCP